MWTEQEGDVCDQQYLGVFHLILPRDAHTVGMVKFYNDGVVRAVTFAYLIYWWVLSVLLVRLNCDCYAQYPWVKGEADIAYDRNSDYLEQI